MKKKCVIDGIQIHLQEGTCSIEREDLFEKCSKFANTFKAVFGLPGYTNRNMKQRDGLPVEINYIAHLVRGSRGKSW